MQPKSADSSQPSKDALLPGRGQRYSDRLKNDPEFRESEDRRRMLFFKTIKKELGGRSVESEMLRRSHQQWLEQQDEEQRAANNAAAILVDAERIL